MNRGIGIAINRQVKQDMVREIGTSYNKDVIVEDAANNQFISGYVQWFQRNFSGFLRKIDFSVFLVFLKRAWPVIHSRVYRFVLYYFN